MDRPLRGRWYLGAEGAIILASRSEPDWHDCSIHPSCATQGWSPAFLRSERRGFSRKKPCNQPDSSAPQMRKGRNRADSDLLLESTDDLEKNPEHENEPCRQANPAKIIEVAPQKADFRLRERQCVKGDHAGDSTAGTDAGNGGIRGRYNVDEIANECRNRDQCDIAQRTQKIFYVIAENEKEIHVADEMDDSGMEKK